VRQGSLLCALAVGVAVAAPIKTGVEPAQGLAPVKVTLPPVQVTLPPVPPTPTPTVASLPPVTTPSLPAVPQLPPVSVPPAPSLPPVSIPSTPAPSTVSASAVRPRQDPAAPERSATPSAPTAPASAAAPAAAPPPTQPASDRSAGRSRAPARHVAGRSRHRVIANGHRHVRTRRRLHAIVRRLQGCLVQVGTTERRVLTLRAGIGAVGAFSRERTARRLGLSPLRVARIERRGLRRLAALGRSGGCTRPSAATSKLPLALTAAPSIDPRGGAGAGASASASSGDRGAVKGVSAHGGPERDAPSVPLPPRPPGGTLIVLAFAAGILALILLVRRELSRR
jgi:hypothetical protein